MDANQDFFLIATKLLGSLALLMFGLKTMSEALQKLAGPGLRHVLSRMTTNRFTGVLTGLLVTATVQSSTATTVMTVSFVNAGLLMLSQAISIIMGANIGTTLTAWIMSAGFTFNITNFVWPAFFLAIFLIYRKKQENIGYFLFGLSFMFLGLGTLRQTGIDMNLSENEAVISFFSSFDPKSFTTTIIFLLIGGVLTMCVQSSAAVMAITMILCSSGALPIYQGIALVMGENIGTTVTSNIAAMTASTQARRAAFAHMFFNVFGVCWMLTVFHPFVDFVCDLAGDSVENLNVVLATFHTCFNLTNTFILIWFIPQIEKFVCWVIKPKKETQQDGERLRYIDFGPVQTPEIALLQAQKEVENFGDRMQAMFAKTSDLVLADDADRFSELFKEIENEEDASDKIELEIARYLEQIGDNHLSDETKQKIRQLIREISELESLGDSCYKIARILNRKQDLSVSLTDAQQDKVKDMMNDINDAMTQMNIVLKGPIQDLDIDESYRIENIINQKRNRLKDENIRALDKHEYDYSLGSLYSDLVSECEMLGDYIINVVEARFGK